MDIFLLILGLALILGGANFLTDGSAALAQRFRVPEFIVGLTIVAVGPNPPPRGRARGGVTGQRPLGYPCTLNTSMTSVFR